MVSIPTKNLNPVTATLFNNCKSKSSMINKNKLIIFFLLLATACLHAQTAQKVVNSKKISLSHNKNFTYKVIDVPNYTFGYNIYADNQLMIHQASIPGLPGNEGFKTKEKAARVAKLVIAKIKKGEMPPTVTEEEMKKIGAIL